MHAVVFDIDGTLLQSASVDDDLYRQAVRTILGPVAFRPALSDYPLVTDSGILAQVCADNSIAEDPRRTKDIVRCFIGLLSAHIHKHGPFEEVPGARRMIARLRASGKHSVAIATGGWRETAELKLRTAGFDLDGIPLATSSDSCVRSEIMRIAIQRLGRECQSVTYFGDGAWDRDACLSLGWNFHAVGPGLAGIESYDGLELA